jgi:hypothetical protein
MWLRQQRITRRNPKTGTAYEQLQELFSLVHFQG